MGGARFRVSGEWRAGVRLSFFRRCTRSRDARRAREGTQPAFCVCGCRVCVCVCVAECLFPSSLCVPSSSRSFPRAWREKQRVECCSLLAHSFVRLVSTFPPELPNHGLPPQDARARRDAEGDADGECGRGVMRPSCPSRPPRAKGDGKREAESVLRFPGPPLSAPRAPGARMPGRNPLRAKQARARSPIRTPLCPARLSAYTKGVSAGRAGLGLRGARGSGREKERTPPLVYPLPPRVRLAALTPRKAVGPSLGLAPGRPEPAVPFACGFRAIPRPGPARFPPRAREGRVRSRLTLLPSPSPLLFPPTHSPASSPTRPPAPSGSRELPRPRTWTARTRAITGSIRAAYLQTTPPHYVGMRMPN